MVVRMRKLRMRARTRHSPTRRGSSNFVASMLHELEISRFRCFQQFAARELTRLNLIVGRNNSGKTCLLEALAIVADGGPAPLARALRARGEVVHVDLAKSNMVAVMPAARHAFSGHALDVGADFTLQTRGEHSGEKRRVHVKYQAGQRLQPKLSQILEPLETGRVAALELTGSAVAALAWELCVDNVTETWDVAIGPDDDISGAWRGPARPPILPARLIRTDLGSRDDITELWGPIAATEHEESVVELLRVVEPQIEKIAATPGPAGGIFFRLRGTRERVPLGSFGEGTTRLFSLACNLISVQHGILLIDEIDTGLHVSTMTSMWQFLARAAERLDVQVFATTHSDDCIRGLASFLRNDPAATNWTKLFRIERGAQTMTSYSAEQIIDASDANIEVR